MKRVLIFAAVLIVAGTFAGCAKKTPPAAAAPEKAVRYGIATEPDHLDPYEATSADSRFILFNIFEGLFKPSPDGRLIPAVASEYSVSPDFLTWTIKLKDDVFFHNGNKVTAEDARYSLERAAGKKLNGLQTIQSVEIADASTIVIRLAAGDPEFYYYLTNAIIPAGYESQNEAPVGTGPFKFVSFTPQYELVLQKHDKYWQSELPKIDRLVFKIKADFNSVMLDLKAGSLDAGTVDNTAVLQLDPKDFNIVYDTTDAPQTLCLNNAYAPLGDPRVRKAFWYAIDPQEIIDVAQNGQATRIASPVVSALAYAYNAECEKLYTTDIERARALLVEAGYGDGFPLEIIVPSVYQPHIDTAQVIVNRLAQIGIRASIKQVDWPTWLSDVYRGRKYQATVIGIDGTTLSPRSYLFRYESSAAENFFNYKNAAYDALYKKNLNEADEEKRASAYKEMQKILAEDAASVYICELVSPRVFKKNITGFRGYPLYVFDASTLTTE